MYIDRKQWHIPEIAVNVNMYQEKVKEKTIITIDQDLFFPGEVEEEQKTRLIEISKLCPISKILAGEIQVRTFQFKDGETEK